MNQFLDFMPEQAASWSADVDFVNNFITYVAAFCTVTITATMLYFGWKYRRKSPDQPVEYITHSVLMETVWTVVPTVICMYVFWYGFVVYRDMREPPANAIEINARGWQWEWEFQYSNGKKSPELYVPIGQPIKIISRATSNDPARVPVNHSLFIPAMRVKEDLVGSEYHYMWFNPIKLGDYPIFCAEYCGTSHYAMKSVLHVVTQSQYDDFLNGRGAVALPPEELGAKLYQQKNCNGCHSLDGSKLVGPSFKGLWGREEALQDGSKVKVDENYIHESLLNPQAKIVQGYPPVMPPQNLSDEEVTGIVAWLKTLK